MMKYEEYEFMDFVQDGYFVRWVKHPDEQADKFWRMWLEQHPEKREEVMHARNIIVDMGYQYDPELKGDDYVEMFENILKKGRQQPLRKHRHPFVFRWPMKIAASLAIAVTAFFILVQHNKVKEDPVPVTAFNTKQNPVGQKLVTWLEDGTKIHLNSGSGIKYPASFPDSLRIVYLEGEAYFEVSRDVVRPFVVVTNDVRTTVLGTSFNVKAYPGEGETNVAVSEGKVQVRHESPRTGMSEHTITRHEMISYDNVTKQAIKQDFDPDVVLAWTKGIIHFKDANIKEIIHTLERWYGVTFTIHRTLDMEKDFSFRYEKKSLEEILQGLGFAFGFEFEIQDKTVTIN